MSLFGAVQRMTPPSDPSTPTQTALMDLSMDLGDFSVLPGVLALNLDYIESESGGAVPKRGAIDIWAEISWSTGAGRQLAEVDVPAHGTSVHVVAGDGLQVRWYRAGDPIAGTVDNDDQLFARMTVGFSDGITPIAQRTQRSVFPVAAPIPAIPRFARQVSVYNDTTAFAAGAFLRLFNERAGAVIALLDLASFPGPFSLPNNCRFWDIVGAPVGSNITAVWGLSI